MLTKQQCMDIVSTSYVNAIAGQAGLICTKPQVDCGIDGIFSEVKVLPNGKRRDTGYKLDFQLKSTGNFIINKDEIIYDLEVKNYIDLIDEEVGTPRILILYLMPAEQEDWIMIDEQEIENNDNKLEYKYSTNFSYCAWWCSLNGMTETSNKETIRIKIPRNQILNKESLSDLMAKVRRGDVI